MISRYALYDIATLSKRFSIAAGLPKGVKPHYNNSPTISAPVIVNEAGIPGVKLMTWGLLPKGARDNNSVFRYKTHIIPSEKIYSKHSWELAVREHRCLVPANGFYELNEGGEKRAFYAEPKDKSLFAFAGVYNSWQDSEGVTRSSFSILTTEPTSDMPDSRMRMPVIVAREEEARWLESEPFNDSSIYYMLRPNPDGLLNVYEVSPAVHSPKPNQPSLIDHI